jgi:hypothetical protein
MPTRTRTDDLGLIDRTVGEKFCQMGDHWKPLRHFYRDASSPDGLQSRCAACHREYLNARRQGATGAAMKAYVASWTKDNRAYRAEQERARRAAESPEERAERRAQDAAYMRLYRARKARERAATVRDRDRALRRFYAHRDEMNAARRERHAEKRSAA